MNESSNNNDSILKIEKISSFTVDHRKIEVGVYISRIDGDITTFDMRHRKPNSNDYLDNLTMHSVEHMFATYIRNSSISNNVIYYGPMGCQTGFYLIVRNADNQMVKEAIFDTLKNIVSHEGEMYGASEVECGNYRNLSLEAAKQECTKYLNILLTTDIDFRYK